MRNFGEKTAWISLSIGVIIIVVFTIFGNFIKLNNSLSPESMANYGTFIGGTAGIFFTLAGYFLIFSTLKSTKQQQFETTFHNRFALFQEFRTHQIALKELPSDKDQKEIIHQGIMFFDYLFINQMKLSYGKRESAEFYKRHLEIHSAQFGYYFGFFEMCLSAIYEANFSNSDIKKNIHFLKNLISQQEEFLFALISLIVEPHRFPLCVEFGKQFDSHYKKLILINHE